MLRRAGAIAAARRAGRYAHWPNVLSDAASLRFLSVGARTGAAGAPAAAESKDSSSGKDSKEGKDSKDGPRKSKWYLPSFSTGVAMVATSVGYYMWCRHQRAEAVAALDDLTGLNQKEGERISELAVLSTADIERIYAQSRRQYAGGLVSAEEVCELVAAQVEGNRAKRKALRERLAAESEAVEEQVLKEAAARKQAAESPVTAAAVKQAAPVAPAPAAAAAAAGVAKKGAAAAAPAGPLPANAVWESVSDATSWLPAELSLRLALGSDWQDIEAFDGYPFQAWLATSLFPSVALNKRKVDLQDMVTALALLIEDYDSPRAASLQPQAAAVLDEKSPLRKALEARGKLSDPHKRRVDFLPFRRLQMAWRVALISRHQKPAAGAAAAGSGGPADARPSGVLGLARGLVGGGGGKDAAASAAAVAATATGAATAAADAASMDLSEAEALFGRLMRTGHFARESLVVPEASWWPVRYRALSPRDVAEIYFREAGCLKEQPVGADGDVAAAAAATASASRITFPELEAAARRQALKRGPHLWYASPNQTSELTDFQLWRKRTKLRIMERLGSAPTVQDELASGVDAGARWRWLGG